MSDTGSQQGTQAQILLVDDSPGNLTLLAGILEHHGYCVGATTSGELALLAAKTELPDLILLDVRMPGIDGYEVCRRLKADAQTRDIPILFISALDDEHDKVKAFQVGGIDYITKPFLPDEVLARVATHLHLRKLTTGLEQTVRARTEELTLTNQRLEQELAERRRAEEALRLSSERLQLATRVARIGIWDWDVVKNELVCDESMYQLYGIRSGDFDGAYDAWIRTVHPEDKARTEGEIQAALRGEREYAPEFRIVRPDGSIRYIKADSRTIKDREGKPLHMIGTNIDITEHRRSEEVLHRTNRELRAISDCNQTLMRATDEQALLDQVCRIVCVKAGYRMAWVGYAQDDAQKTIRPVAWSGAEEGYLAAMQASWSDSERGCRPAGAAIRTGQTVCIQDLAKDPQAAPWRELALQRGYQSTIALPLKDEDAHTHGVFVIYSAVPNAFTPDEVRLLEELASDLAFGITTLRLREEHDRAEAALRTSEEKYRELVQLANSIILRWTSDGRVVFLNEYGQRFFGYSAEEIVGRHVVGTIVPPVDSSGEDLRQLMDKICASSSAYEQNENENMRRNGEPVWIAWSNRTVRDAKGRAIEILSIGTDITERKRAEVELRQAKKTADEANRAKDQFLAVLSHELRTPLTPVLATVTALETQGELSAEIREDLQLIRRNVALETKLIDDLLDFTRLTRGKIQLHYEVVDAHACLEAALQVCQGQIQDRHLRVLRDLQAQQHQIWADPARLQQVFWNLLQNAAKFTPEHGTIHLRSCNQDGRIQLQVQDNGIGIEPTMLPRLFDAFVQAEQTKARRFGGLGMGLAIGKSIMDLHQGQLRAFSDGAGQGATFTVELAVLAAPPIVAVPPPPVEVPTPRQGQHILLVEDTPDTLKVLTRLLTRWGHQVTPADSVHAALEYAAKERFDLLVSDIGLPDGSGLDIMRQLKQEYGLRGIAISGYGMDEDIKQSQEAGFARHLTKPVSLDALQAAVCEVVPS